MPTDVRIDVFVVRAIALKAGLSSRNLDTSSAARCWASPAEPPFPAIKTFLLFLYASIIAKAIFSISEIIVSFFKISSLVSLDFLI